MNVKIMSIDPATHYTGYAVFEEAAVQASNAPMGVGLKQYGLVRARQKDPFDIRALDIASRLRGLMVLHEITHLVLEYPQFQGGVKGQHSSRKGGTLMLAFLCGSICTGWHLRVSVVARETQGEVLLPLPCLVTPSTWKGQLTKTITRQRCKKSYGVDWEKKVDDNITDAIMIGDWWIKKEAKWTPLGRIDTKRVDFKPHGENEEDKNLLIGGD